MSKTEKRIIGGIIIFVSLAAVWGWYHNPLTQLTTKYTAAPAIPAAAKIPTVNLPVKQVVALEKKAASKKLKLPDAISNDDKKQIIATAQVPETDTTGKTDLVAVMDTDKGTTEIIAKQQPLSFFALENKRAIGLRYGFSTLKGISDTASKINNEADIYGRWDVLRVGSVHLGLYGEVNSLGDGKAMIQAEYRF
ncbi:MAG: hypothetical protein WC637_00455 [Victivallales bacterium]|jgi:hypothetical protein